MKTCIRWMSRARFTSGLYSIENSESSGFSLVVCSKPGFAENLSTAVSGSVSAVLSDMVVGMELLSIGGRRVFNIRRQNVDVEDAAREEFRTDKGAGAETTPGTNLFLQSWQILFRRLSSSSESVVTVALNQFDSPVHDDKTHLIEHIDLLSFETHGVLL